MDLIARTICGQEKFEFLDISKNLSVPYISDCARLSVFSFVPPLFLFLLSPLLLCTIFKSKAAAVRVNSIVISRMILCVVLIIDSVIILCRSFYKWEAGSPILPFLPPLFNVLAFGFTLFLLYECKERGILTSGVLFNFWLLTTVCGFPEFRTQIESLSLSKGCVSIEFLLCAIYYLSIVTELILSCFADVPKGRIQKTKQCPEEESSFLNQISFHWFNGMALKGFRQPLNESDLWDLKRCDQSSVLVPQFYKHWKPVTTAYCERKRRLKDSSEEILEPPVRDMPSVLWPLFKTFRGAFLKGAVLKFIFDLMQFIPPQLLSQLILFIEDVKQPMWMGIGVALLMFVLSVIQSFILHQYFHTMFTLGMNICSVLTSAVYSKALVLSNSARKQRTVGEIVNLMAVDVQRIQDMATYVMLFWSAPLQVSLAIYFLWKLLGVSVIGGVLILIVMIPFNSLISMKMKKCQVEQMKHKDERLKLMSEILNGIKVLKLYAWEKSMEKKVLAIREKELTALKKVAFYNAATTLSWSCAPFLVAVLTFGVYVNMDPMNNLLTPQVTFVGISLFNILRFPLAIFAIIWSQAIQCVVSNKRLKSFLSADEMDNYVQEIGPVQDAVTIKNGSFSWEASQPALKNIDFNVQKGHLVAIVGRVGSGKSSLISALLGEMHKLAGTVMISGSVAYVPQEAWIQNLTLQSNIVFKCSYNQEFYESVLDACALLPDLAALPAGDKTEIGEKGINLSGGQKQRVSLARAVYANRDIYFLDDPLSAVDAHVGKHLFDRVLSSKTGLLAKKTRLLVTNALHFLRYCDDIIVMKDGAIAEVGTFEGLMSSSGALTEFLEEVLIEGARNRKRLESIGDQEVEIVLGELERFNPAKRQRIQSQLSQITVSSDESFKTAQSPASDDKVETSTAYERGTRAITPVTVPNDADVCSEKEALLKTSKPPSLSNRISKSALIQKEAIAEGKVKWEVYVTYIRAIGFAVTFIFFSIYVLASVLGVASNLWLADWSDHAKIRNSSLTEDDTNLRLVIYASLGLGQAIFVSFGAVVMALGMVHASRYLHELILKNILKSPMIFFDVTPLGRILNRFGKDVDMIDTRVPSSLMSTIGCIVQGFSILIIPIIVTPPILFFIVVLSVVYGLILRFYVSTSRQLKRLESSTRSPVYSHFQESIQGAASIRAYGCVDYFISESQRKVDNNLATYYPSIVANRWLAVRLELVGNSIVLFSALFAVLCRDWERWTITPGLVGLSVAYALNITQTLNWAVRMTSELETNIVAVERLKEYAEIPPEGAKSHTQPPSDWPSQGAISFRHLCLRYREDLDLVLKDIDAQIHSGEKIGIIGRTGSGKSSLALALFRIVEADSGHIDIDGINISSVPLQKLRSRLTVVPQDPVLFSGTFRMNLDPFNQFTDEKLWEALRLAHLESVVSTFPDRLEHNISEGGGNLSVGQRQLVCLARALLRKSQILVLDEAAASVDAETDALIQRTIKEEFSQCTVLTIAHRLQSIADYDRLLALKDGKVNEFETPSHLLNDKNSLYYSLAKEADMV